MDPLKYLPLVLFIETLKCCIFTSLSELVLAQSVMGLHVAAGVVWHDILGVSVVHLVPYCWFWAVDFFLLLETNVLALELLFLWVGFQWCGLRFAGLVSLVVVGVSGFLFVCFVKVLFKICLAFQENTFLARQLLESCVWICCISKGIFIC